MEAAREIELALRDALALYGIAGAVVVRDKQLELFGSGTPIAIELDAIVEQWPLLPADMRERRIVELARRLAAAVRAGAANTERPRRRSAPVVVAAAVAVAALLAGGFVLLRGHAHAPAPAPAAAAGAPTETAEQAAARRARVCEATRKRVYAGASIGPFDVEGWVAELWLARGGKDLAQDPAIVALASGGKLAKSADEKLAALDDGTVEIAPGVPAAAGEPAASAGGGVTIRFGGAYAGAFLDAELRPRLLALADRVADAVSADEGAFYGRCAHLASHELGAWFRGADAPAAAASLVYGMGLFAEMRAVDHGALAKLEGATDLEKLRRAARSLDDTALAAMIGVQGGSVTGPKGGAVSITFPLAGGTRAITASRTVARKLGVGIGSD